MISFILAGVGGQGTVLASKFIAKAAMSKGMKVRTSETIGMAQRGGSVVSHVRVGEEIYSPLIPLKSADVIIGFEPGEAVRCLPYLKKGGTAIVSNNAIKPITDSLAKTNYSGDEMLLFLEKNVSRLVVLDTNKIISECGSSKVLNVALLGAAAKAGVLGFSIEDLAEIIRTNLPEKFINLNIKALYAGAATISKE